MDSKIEKSNLQETKLIIENILELPVLFHALTIKEYKNEENNSTDLINYNKKDFYKPIFTSFPIQNTQ